MSFSTEERGVLLMTTGIGAEVVQRLEEAGFHSLDQLRTLGVDRVIEAMCSHVGTNAWANRRRALQRALAHQRAHDNQREHDNRRAA
jgi:hypothetical protein